MNTQRRGALSVAAGAAVWGLFWIPLRYLDKLGLHGLWAIAAVSLTAALAALSLGIAFRHPAKHSFYTLRSTWKIGVALGLSMVLYFVGVLFSDVIRVIFLFYLLPVWTTLAARLLYAESIRPAQLVVIATALVGLWLLLGGGNNLPIPHNFGDWCGIGAGFCWGVSLALLRGHPSTDPLISTLVTLLIGGSLAISVALLLSATPNISSQALPAPTGLIQATLIATLFGCLVLFPAMYSQIWGARLIPAPTAALVTMVEILVATVSAYFLIGSKLSAISWVGGLLIVSAVVVDLTLQYRRLQL